jgi:hypothetical protein
MMYVRYECGKVFSCKRMDFLCSINVTIKRLGSMKQDGRINSRFISKASAHLRIIASQFCGCVCLKSLGEIMEKFPTRELRRVYLRLLFAHLCSSSLTIINLVLLKKLKRRMIFLFQSGFVLEVKVALHEKRNKLRQSVMLRRKCHISLHCAKSFKT